MIPPTKEPDLAPAGLALLVIFGLLIWYDRPMESSRPLYPDVQHPNRHPAGDVYGSWLWEDPFGFDPMAAGTDTKVAARPKDTAHNKEEQKSGKKHEHLSCKDKLAAIVHHPSGSVKQVKILAPLLTVRSNTRDIENRELRTRYRYAVIAGLMESGYRPVEPDRLHFCSIQNNSGDRKYDVRWEHYDSEGKPDLIVAWMNGEIFTGQKAGANKKPGTKKPDMPEIFKSTILPISKQTQSFHIYDLNNILDQGLSEEIGKNKEYGKIHLIKPLDTDNKGLAAGLTGELGRRNIKEPSEVMIIAEQNSENARNLASRFSDSFRESFAECKPDTCCAKMQPAVNDENSHCKIRSIFYLKGLDAYQQILHKQDGNENQASKRADRLSAIDLHNPPPLPIGPSQFDYFHRLAEQIKDSHNEINLEKRDSGIKAVIVFGSDFYDKMLILEALRAEMPNILVLTTGLDAQMLHPQHWRSARNLVVASPFNLRLNEKYQKEFPPFRDSLQTEIFYRTISSVTNHIPDQIEKSGITSSPVFEIGRNGPVRLGPAPENEGLNGLHPPDHTLEQAKERLWLLAGILGFLIWFFYEIRPDSGKTSTYLLLGTLAIFAFAWVSATNQSGEPLSFTDGVSLLPTIFIQFIAILMAGAFLYIARKKLAENFCFLHKQHFDITLDETGMPSRDASIPLSSAILIVTIAVYAINDVSPSSFQFWLCIAILVFFAILYFVIDEFGVEIGKDNFNFNSIKHWIEKDICGTTPDQDRNSCRPDNRSGDSSPSYRDYENNLWKEYYNYGLFRRRVRRVAAIWLFFAIIETILIYLLPPWPLPCRDTTCDWVSGTGVISFSVSMLLLFFILDAVRLNFYWIQKLRKQHPLLTGRMTPEDLSASNNATKNTLLEPLEQIVVVVAERTQVVDKLIYYPMLCIMLMLFAKITYFDNQDFPLSKGITFAASISLLFLSGFLLRYEAEKLKRSVLKSVEILRINNICTRRDINAARDRIKNICEGAFQPMFEQPVMRALLIILASVGLFTGEYLKLLG